MGWIVFFLVVAYGIPVVPVWCFLYLGSRPRRGRFLSWLVASFGAWLWLPLLAWVYVGVRLTTTRPQRIDARRRVNDDQVIGHMENLLAASYGAESP